MKFEDWKDLFKASIAQRRWNIYPAVSVKQIVEAVESEDSIVLVKSILRKYESISVSSSGTNGTADPLSPRSLVLKLAEVEITPPVIPEPEPEDGKPETGGS